jgi:hypothetical protein
MMDDEGPWLEPLSGSRGNLADNPRRCLGAEADFAQLLLEVLNGIRIKGDGVVVRICFGNGLLPVFVLLHNLGAAQDLFSLAR